MDAWKQRRPLRSIIFLSWCAVAICLADGRSLFGQAQDNNLLASTDRGDADLLIILRRQYLEKDIDALNGTLGTLVDHLKPLRGASNGDYGPCLTRSGAVDPLRHYYRVLFSDDESKVLRTFLFHAGVDIASTELPGVKEICQIWL